MSDQAKTTRPVAARRIQLTRRRPRRDASPDTTLTDSWPPRLNTSL
jgi:hypothetical protein